MAATSPTSAWRYYDFTPQGVGNWSQEWFDYPDIAASSGSLFISTNCFSQANQFRRSVALRLSLDELRSYAPLNYRYFDRTEVGSLRLTQGAANTMYIGTHLNLGALRVFSWIDGDANYQTKDFSIQPWVRGGASSPGPDGRDWLGFVDGRITAAWAAGPSQGFSWTSAQGGSFPRPHARAAVIDWNAGTVLRQPHLWNSTIAFAYPAAAVNSDSRIGVSVGYGGGSLHPSHAVGVLNADSSWSLVATELGGSGPITNRWGDYLTVRTNGQTQSRFACTGFTLAGGPNQQDIVARVVQFDASHAERSLRAPTPVPGETPPLPDLTALRKVLSTEKRVKFSKTVRRSSTASTAAMDAVRSLSYDAKKAVVPLAAPAEMERFAKMAKLPPAHSFFYEQPETVCLPDDRLQVVDTAEAPWNINCQLVITFQDGTQAIGTGWLHGPRLVVTAGHCVHEGEAGNYFKSVEVIPGMNGPTRPFGSQHSSVLRASEAWRTHGTPADDYGAIVLPQAFKSADGKSPGTLGTAALSDPELNALTLKISGYPADKLFGTQWRDAGPVGTVLPARLAYSIDTFGGHSGSAVEATVSGQPRAVGIHNYGGCPNRCTRITPAVKTDLDKWLAESTSP